MKEKIIFIDWHGTLSDSKFFGHLEGTREYEIIETSLFKNQRHLINPWMRGEMGTEDIISIINSDTNLDFDYLLKEFIYSCQNMTVSENVLDRIKEIREGGTKVFIATDNMDSFTRWTAPALHLCIYFDGILNSFEIKSLKRDFENNESQFFRKYLSDNNLNPQDCVLIDDNEDKDDLINQYGIRYIKIDKSSELENVLKVL